MSEASIPAKPTPAPPILLSAEVRDFLLALADDKHLMGQQHAEWIGVTPFLEEDLAFCSIGQDELGHAAMLYELIVTAKMSADVDSSTDASHDAIDMGTSSDGTSASTLSGSAAGPGVVPLDAEALDRAIDELAFWRDGDDYRSCWFTEMVLEDWSQALVRHWMFDQADGLRWQLLAQSTLAPLAELCGRVEREETFHRRHADGLLDLLLADPESRSPLIAAFETLAPLATGMFDPVAGETEAVAQGVASAPLSACLRQWQNLCEARFTVTLPVRAWLPSPNQQMRTQRSPDFAALMARMTEVLNIDRTARW